MGHLHVFSSFPLKICQAAGIFPVNENLQIHKNLSVLLTYREQSITLPQEYLIFSRNI